MNHRDLSSKLVSITINVLKKPVRSKVRALGQADLKEPDRPIVCLEVRLPLPLPPPPSHPRCSPWQRDVALQNRTRIYVTARPMRGEGSAWKEGRGLRAYVGEFQRSVVRSAACRKRSTLSNTAPLPGQLQQLRGENSRV